MSRSKPGSGNRVVQAITLAGCLVIIYLVAGNLLLNWGILPQMLSRNTDLSSIEWSSGWTILPGHLHVSGLKIRGQTPQQQWSISISRSTVRLAPWGLFSRTLQLQSFTVDGVTAAVHQHIPAAPASTSEPGSLTSAPLPPGQASQPDATAISGTSPTNERTGNGSGWTIVVKDADIAEIRALELDDYRFTGQGRLQLDDLHFRPDGSLAVARSLLQLHSGILMAGSQSIAQDLQSDAELRLDRFVPGETPGAGSSKFVSGRIGVTGSLESFGFINRYLGDSGWLKLDGKGSLKGDILIERGRLLDGSELSIDSPDLTVELDERHAAGPGLRHRIRGAGRIDGDVRTAPAGGETRLQVELKDITMHTQPQDQLFLKGKVFQLSLTGPPVNLSEKIAEPAVLMQWQEAVMPDIGVLNAYLPGGLPFSLVSGGARMNGHLAYADQVFSGKFDLAGEAIAGTFLEQSVVGNLGVELNLKRADLATRLLDLSGTRIQMQTATPATAEAPLQTLVTIKEARLKARPDSHQAARPGIRTPVSGVVRLEGSVANIGFINSFLHSAQRLQFSGDGRINANLRLNNGQMAPGSTLQVESDHLVSRFLDFEASGAGLLQATIEGKPEAPAGRIESFLKSFGLRRLDEPVPYINGRDFQITTVGRRFDSMQGLRDLDTLVKLTSAEIPDISIYNSYLPKDAGVSIVSGKGEVSADLRLSGVSGSGNLEMQAKDVEVHVRDQTIKGDLRISTRLTDGNLEEMTFDASGTQLRIDNGSLYSENVTRDEQWWGQIDVNHGRMIWKRPLQLDAAINLQLRDSGLLVHLFVKQTQERQWLNDLLTIKDVTGESQVLLNDKSIVLRNTRIAGEKLLVLANLHLSEEKMGGGMYAKYGILGIGIELKNDERTLKIVKPRKWYDGFSETFGTGPR